MIVLLAALLGLQDAPTIVDPVPVTLVAVDTAVAVSTFEKLCFEPGLDMDATTKAVAASTLRFVAEPRFEGNGIIQQRWKAPEAGLTLTLPAEPRLRGVGIPQCDLIMVGKQAHTPAELLTIGRPIAEHYASSAIRERNSSALDWDNPDGGDFSEFSVVSYPESSEPSHSISLLLATYTPEGYAWIEEQSKAYRTSKVKPVQEKVPQ